MLSILREEQHQLISVAVPTRNRVTVINDFVKSFANSINPKVDGYTKTYVMPELHIIYDAPDKMSHYCGFDMTPTETTNVDKSSLTELWNQAIISSPTDWVLVCNDDITFNKGWVEYLEGQIETGKYLLIHLFHYGAFCIHKSLILEIGWFDENFRGGGFEDVDHMLRMSEAGLKDLVDRSHDFIRVDNDVEIGHFINHHKAQLHKQGITKGTGWDGKNNGTYIMEKWGRKDNTNWRIPSFRQSLEVDWHPSVTKKYAEKFHCSSKAQLVNLRSIEEKRAIHP